MRILYIHQYFKTPQEGGAIRSWHLANALADDAHEVLVISSHNKKSGLRHFGNVKVHYVKVAYDNSFSYGKRIRAFVSFSYKALRIIMSEKRPDLLFATSTPLTVGILALVIKKLKGIPYIFEVRDLWPLVPEEMGIFKNKSIIKTAYFFEKKIYKNADRIIALSPPIETYISTRINDKKKVVCIPNFSDCEYFVPHKNTYSDKYPLVNGKFVIGYFGAAGKANDLLRLAEAAAYFKNAGIRKVVFLVISSGAELFEIQRYAFGHDLDNIIFSDFQDKEKIREALSLCDASYVSYADFPSLWTGSPNKFFDGIASGKLIILNFEGWIKAIVEEYDCGIYYDRNKPEQLWEKLEPFLNNSGLLEKAQVNSRRLALEKFSKKDLVAKFLTLFK
ncbi:a-glycosyltransferase [Sporocytophaga myxococcoides]|uniref:A-glycosyltransferase n=1 Tax=Sporocytophaga myxococcoides TaxID=153721 RepID=A0A098LBW6_9BACT|nr:glycosyltransferase family 4 protein [Sporocytophaga myxococcoides]GAL84416.1 a-glycosyltransferase [Sporocytophaga myxococcoides]